jgi:hypothetical protein
MIYTDKCENLIDYKMHTQYVCVYVYIYTQFYESDTGKKKKRRRRNNNVLCGVVGK